MKKNQFFLQKKTRTNRLIQILCLSFFLVGASANVFADSSVVDVQAVQQSRVVKGAVADEGGELIIGVSARISGSSTGTWQYSF